VKAVSDLYAPVSGVVTAVHEELLDAPERIASDPYGNGWLLKIRLTHPEETEKLLTAADYQAHLVDDCPRLYSLFFESFK
jgi:glycine cleavage system H protein